MVDLFIIWGDLVLMTGTAFLLFTNLAQAAKIVNLLSKRDRIQKIVNEADIVLRDVHSEEAKRIVERLVRVYEKKTDYCYHYEQACILKVTVLSCYFCKVALMSFTRPFCKKII